eukprot:11816202-Ditylum_brightwellii.AAC.1
MSGNYEGDKAENLPAVNHWLKNHIRRSNTPPIKVTLSQQEYYSGTKTSPQVPHHLEGITAITVQHCQAKGYQMYTGS